MQFDVNIRLYEYCGLDHTNHYKNGICWFSADYTVLRLRGYESG